MKKTLLVFALFMAHEAIAADLCPNLLANLEAPLKNDPKLVKQVTSGLIGYLETLVERQIIDDRELIRLIDNLRQGILENPIREEDTQISSSLHIHREGLEEYIKTVNVDQTVLLDWAEKNLKEKNRVRSRREETRVETQGIHHKMEFGRVEPGQFEMGEGRRKVKVTITKPFEMMSTLVTQKQWSMIMEENPSHFVDGEHTVVMIIQGKQIKMQPNNPVEQVTWEDIQKYITKLNELSDRDDPRLYQIMLGHKKGDQYRPPTEAEWEYVVRDRGRANGTYHFGDNEVDLKDYGWYQVNANQMTHPVAQLKPLIVDGKEFYDMHGNVWELMQDSWDGNSPLKSGKNPVGTKGYGRVMRGGSWNYYARGLRSAYRGNCSPGIRYSSVGFRLVRVLQ